MLSPLTLRKEYYEIFLKKCIRILIQKKINKSDDEPLQAQPSYYNFGKLDLAKINF